MISDIEYRISDIGFSEIKGAGAYHEKREGLRMGNGAEIQGRLSDFAVRVMELRDGLPKTFAGRHIGEQLLRAGTAVAANYAEVRGAESRNDFIHKLGVVRKEMNESLVWLRLLEQRQLVADNAVNPLCKQCDELCRIIAASRITAERNARMERKR